VGPLLSAADVDVQLSQADLNSILANNGPGSDASFDALINSLEAAGMDRLVLDVGQVAALAADGITLDAGTDVLITGTGFLGATGVGPLLSAADVDVQLSETDLQWILAAGSAPAIDARLDELVAGLRGAGMDRLILDPGQVAALGAVGGVDFDFADDYSVLVTGTGFLSAPGVTTLLGNVNVDVQLSTSDLAGLFGASGGAQSALDSLVDSINSLDSGFVSLGTVTGDARLALDIGAVQALAAAGLDFGSTADVLVTGTGFLSAPAPLLAQVTELLDDANVTLGLSSADAAYLGSFATADSFDLAIGSLESKMAAVDIDTLQFTSGDLAGLVDALSGSLGPSAVFDGFSTASGIDSVLVTGTGFLDQGSGTLDNLFDAYDTPSDVDGVSLDEQIVKLLGGHTPY
jgi:ribosomal protein L12E/L44/L45/RPP1/RPP2